MAKTKKKLRMVKKDTVAEDFATVIKRLNINNG